MSPVSASSSLVALRGVSKTFPTGLAGLDLEVRIGGRIERATEGVVEWAPTAVSASYEVVRQLLGHRSLRTTN
jgi:hypothetical protein